MAGHPKHSEAGSPRGGKPAYADQVEHPKARARLASEGGPKEEAIDLMVMADE